MAHFLCSLAIGLALIAVCGCASAPQSPTTRAGLAVPSGPVIPAGATPASDQAAAQIKAARALGYVPRRSDGVTVYCRKEAVVWSRFTKDSCIKEDQIADVVQRAINDQGKLEALQRECVGADNCSKK